MKKSSVSPKWLLQLQSWAYPLIICFTRVDVCLWRSKVDVKCLHQSISTLFIFWCNIFQWNQITAILIGLSIQITPDIAYLCLPQAGTAERLYEPSFLHRFWGSELQPSLVWKVLYSLSNFPRVQYLFLKPKFSSFFLHV